MDKAGFKVLRSIPCLLSILLWLIVAPAALAGGPPGKEMIQVPLRWCVIGEDRNGNGKWDPGEEGTPAFVNPAGAPGQPEPDADNVLWRRHERASDNLWIPQADITFRSGVPEMVRDLASFPVIPDPDPEIGRYGDVVFEGGGFGVASDELMDVIVSCQREWSARFPEARGPVVINVGRFINARGIKSQFLGLTSSPAFGCSPLTGRGPFCADPEKASITNTSGRWIAVIDNSLDSDAIPYDLTLAHELGHFLWLEHGDGLDNDADGVFDECCDPDEDPGALPTSLMRPSSPEPLITSLQRRAARAVAKVSEGAKVDPPAILLDGDTLDDMAIDSLHDVVSRSVDIATASVVVNVRAQKLLLSQQLLGILPPGQRAQYVLFVDTDGNAATGGTPSVLGFATAFEGAEIVASISVGPEGGRTVTPAVWKSDGSGFSRVSDPGIRTDVVTVNEAESGFPLYDVAWIELPLSVAQPVGVPLRFQAIAENAGLTVTERDQLPDGPTDTGVSLFLVPPRFSVCSVTPGLAQRSASVRVEVEGLLPHRDVKVILGDEMVGLGATDSLGAARISFTIPPTARSGLRLVTVGVIGTALTADCGVEVLEPLDCNSNGTDDTVDVSSGSSADVNGTGVPDECEQGSVGWVLEGTAQGGQISMTIDGFSSSCTLTVVTSAGESAATVAANVAAAVNADPCLSAQGIVATAAGNKLRITGLDLAPDNVTETVTDPGLSHAMDIADIPALSWAGLVLLALVLASMSIALIRRRSVTSGSQQL